jgi:hypothetical protein
MPSPDPISVSVPTSRLRAVAVVLVVLSHAGLGGLAGGYVGVDVFFVISGFLITTLLVKELGRSGTISLRRFYARRATLLLPASTVVILVTLIGSWLWLPATRFRSITLDALSSTFYGINWRLAAEGTDYLNATAAPSPLQHLWSLAVEEQFYFVWPLLSGNEIPTAGHADDALWVKDWQKSFDRLSMPGTQLVLLQDSPWPQGTAPECAASHADNLTACDRPRTKSIVEPARRQEVALAARADGIKVIDPTPWFCTTTCPVVVGNTFVFKDNSHLTTAYARALAPLVGKAPLGAA